MCNTIAIILAIAVGAIIALLLSSGSPPECSPGSAPALFTDCKVTP